MVGDRGADRARAGYDDSGHPRSSSRSPSVSCRSGRRTSSRTGSAAQPEQELQRGVPREALDRGAQLAERDRSGRRRLAHDRRDPVRERRREPGDGAGRARRDAVEDQRLRADEDVEPFEQVGREAVERRVGDLQAGEVRRPLAQLGDDRERDGVAARALELVDVERQRRARGGGRDEVLEQRALVELEVRRPDHGDRVGARLRGVRRERDGVRGRLRAAVRGYLQPARRGRDEGLEHAPPLVDAEEDPLAGRPEREQAVEPGRGEEVDVRRNASSSSAVARERRHGGGESTSQHAATLLRVRRGPADKAPPLLTTAASTSRASASAGPRRSITRSRLSQVAMSRPASPASTSAPSPPIRMSLPGRRRAGRSPRAHAGGRCRRGRRSRHGRACRRGRRR